jgi:hypothetical protein
MMFFTKHPQVSRFIMASISVFMMYHKAATAVLFAISVTNVTTTFLNSFLFCLAQLRHFITSFLDLIRTFIMCYNIAPCRSPPQVGWAELESTNRSHGSASQPHCVHYFATSPPPHFLKTIITHYYCNFKAVLHNLLKLTDAHYYSKLIEDKPGRGEYHASLSILL